MYKSESELAPGIEVVVAAVVVVVIVEQVEWVVAAPVVAEVPTIVVVLVVEHELAAPAVAVAVGLAVVVVGGFDSELAPVLVVDFAGFAEHDSARLVD